MVPLALAKLFFHSGSFISTQVTTKSMSIADLFEVFRALDSLLYNWFLSGSGLMPLLNHHVTLSLNPEGLLADHDLLDQLVRQLHALRTDIAKILNRLFNVFVNDSVRLASMDSVQGKHGGLD